MACARLAALITPGGWGVSRRELAGAEEAGAEAARSDSRWELAGAEVAGAQCRLRPGVIDVVLSADLTPQ